METLKLEVASEVYAAIERYQADLNETIAETGIDEFSREEAAAVLLKLILKGKGYLEEKQ